MFKWAKPLETFLSRNFPLLFNIFLLLHGEVGDVGVGGDLELEDPLGGGGAPVEHRAVDGGEGVARHDGGLDGQLLDEGSGLLHDTQARHLPLHTEDAAVPSEDPTRNFHADKVVLARSDAVIESASRPEWPFQ